MARQFLRVAQVFLLRSASGNDAGNIARFRLIAASSPSSSQDDAALAKLFADEQGSLRRRLRGILGSLSDADDLAQEACLRAWDKRDTIREQDPRGFLFRIAANLAIDRRRHHARNAVAAAVSDEALLAAAPDALTPERILLARRELQAVQRAIPLLPEPQRRALELTDEGRTFAEIAVILGCSQATAWRHLRAAHEAMQRARDGVSVSSSPEKGRAR